MTNPPLGKTTLPESAIGAPALANVNPYTDPLAIAWTGTDATNHVNIGRSSNPTTFAGFNKVTLNETSPNGPGLAFGNNQLFLAWTGRDSAHSLNTLHNVEFSSGPTNLQFKQTFSESSVAGLTVAPLEGGHELFIAWTGGDSQHHLNVAIIAAIL